MATGAKLSSKIQLKIYEMNKLGIKHHSIANHLNLDVQLVRQCIRSMNLPAKNQTEKPDEKAIYNFLESTAMNISRQEAERKTIMRFKISYDTFNLYYSKWRSAYMEKGLDQF